MKNSLPSIHVLEVLLPQPKENVCMLPFNPSGFAPPYCQRVAFFKLESSLLHGRVTHGLKLLLLLSVLVNGLFVAPPQAGHGVLLDANASVKIGPRCVLSVKS